MENTLYYHNLWAIWTGDGTEILNYYADEDEAKRGLESMLENSEDRFHLARYGLEHSYATAER